ncbi:MAG: alanine dehydrogenase [Candidatus Bathyarchaeia archaeon]|nr:alanine dehydrogenase [Candidatus Bathyarchaeota archaeon]
MDLLFISQDEVAALLDMRDTLAAVEDSFKEKGLGHVQMPPKLYLYYARHNGDLRVMPCYMERSEKSGVKIVNVHPENPTSKGLPTIMAVIMLVDPSTGAPMAIMDGTLITAIRTGAASGVATKYLARRDCETLGLVGAGGQALRQLEAIAEVAPIRNVKVYDKYREKAQRFIKEVEGKFSLTFKAVDSVEECVRGSDIITTITPSRGTIVEDEWVEEGTHINAIGADAPGKQELDPRTLKRARIVVDDWEQACHSGEVNVPLSQGLISKEDIYGELGEIVCGVKGGRESAQEITIFDSTGLAVQDVATAWIVYERAKKKGVGTWLTLFR